MTAMRVRPGLFRLPLVVLLLGSSGCSSVRSRSARPAPRRPPPAGTPVAPVDLPDPGSADARIPLEPAALEVQEGIASYYSDALIGNATASGVPYDAEALVAAHRSLPFGTIVRVTSLENRRSVVVRIVDRGPWAGKDRVIDLSRRAAEVLDFVRDGLVRVRLEVLEYGAREGP
jgi:rare lipoprotein A